MGDRKSRRDIKSSGPVILPQVDPAVLRELAKKAQVHFFSSRS